MKVPFLDLGAAYQELKTQFDAVYRRVMDSGWYLLGRETEALEAAFASYCGVKHCITVGNGLDALLLLLRASGIGPGDEVLVPGHTFIATWLAVSHVGATPVAVDVDPMSCNLDPDRLEEAITPATRAIIPVHLYGQPADMEPINGVARRHGLLVFEDAAHAHGAWYHGRRVGSLAHGAGFSFYPGKNLGCFSDGGAVTTDDDALAESVRVFRNYGSRIKYVNEVQGINSRLDELQAAFLGVRLQALEEWNERRARIAMLYRRLLGDVNGVSLPQPPSWCRPVWHLFVIRCQRRDELQRHLAQCGITALIHYPIPPHLSGAYADGSCRVMAVDVSERLAREVLSLPIGPHLSDAEVRTVADAVRSFAARTRLAA